MTKEIFGRQPPQTESSNLPYKRAKGEQAGTPVAPVKEGRPNRFQEEAYYYCDVVRSFGSSIPIVADDQQTRATT